MKRIFTFFFLALMALSLACAGKVWTPPVECEGQPSLILERIPKPKEASLVLQLANLEMLKHNAYGAEDASEVIDTIDEYLDAGITYFDLFVYVTEMFSRVNEKYGTEIFLISQYMEVAAEPILISECDKTLIRNHLEKQRRVLLLSK